MQTYECIIIWAGPAGLWTALKLQETWVDYMILEAETVGSSFKKWNSETRFISPSFPSNAFGQVDLNSIHHETSPGFTFRTEHVNGQEYAQYLNMMVKQYDITVQENEKVVKIEKSWDDFIVKTTTAEYGCNYIVSAIWEFGFPFDGDIQGSEHGIHSSKIPNYDDYKTGTNRIPIIGWYESSVDAASGLHLKWRSLHIFSSGKMDEVTTSDPSEILSLYSLERLKNIQENGDIQFTQDSIAEIKKTDAWYILVWKSWSEYSFSKQPILATGFQSWFSFLKDKVSYRPDGQPDLNEVDELKKTDNIFVVGPQVRQGENIFCFVYKFRLRFWIVALEIAQRLWKDIDYYSFQEKWEKQWFFLDDLWACGDECIC